VIEFRPRNTGNRIKAKKYGYKNKGQELLVIEFRPRNTGNRIQAKKYW
jgi:hypothetical protein